MNPETRTGRERGFTLIEAIMVITITGILAAMVAVFIRAPVEGYFDTVRRAKLTDEADTSLRFIGRELHAALPNSIGCNSSGGSGTLSFIPIRSGGRYRENATGAGSGSPLLFNASTVKFDAIGGTGDATQRDAYGQSVSSGTAAVGNLGSGVSACDATQGTPQNTLAVAALGGSVTFASKTVPQACDLQGATAPDANDRISGRFYMVGANTITYSCGAGGLTRKVGSGTAGTLSGSVNSCQISCSGKNATVQTISIQLTLTESGESMSLFRQIHVENYP